MMEMKMLLAKIAGLVGICLMLTVVCSHAASLTVTTTADAGAGSLRQALIDATTNAAANVITFNVPTNDPGYSAAENRFTINLLSPLPQIPLAALTLDNNQPQGITVKGNNSFRIFTLVNSAVATINNLTISDGLSDDGFGGGIFMGDSSTLNLNGCTISNNIAGIRGGGIYMSNSSTLSLTNSTLRNNTAVNGGGIFINDSGTLNMDKSTINGNTANSGGSGGGIFNGTSGTINATSSTIDGNSASNSGGGIFNAATLTLTNSTVTGNSATNGGGIYNNFTATLLNNLVALNTASDGSDLLGRGSLGNAFTGTYNLIGNIDGSEGISSAPNQFGTTMVPLDPQIGTLQNNGGPTLTRALQQGSPAIDQGNSPDIITDQRGQRRVFDSPFTSNMGDGTDIGAYELQSVTAAELSLSGTVKTSSGKGIVNARLLMFDTATGINRTAFTDKLGKYTLEGIDTNSFVLLSVQKAGYVFEPSIRALSLTESLDDADFVGTRLTKDKSVFDGKH